MKHGYYIRPDNCDRRYYLIARTYTHDDGLTWFGSIYRAVVDDFGNLQYVGAL